MCLCFKNYEKNYENFVLILILISSKFIYECHFQAILNYILLPFQIDSVDVKITLIIAPKIGNTIWAECSA